MKKLFEKLLSELSKDGLISESKSADFSAMFEAASEKLRIMAMDEAKSLVDNDYTQKVTELVEAIDTKHSAQFMEAMKVAKSVHAAEMNELKKMMEKKQTSAELKVVSDYLDTQLESVLPDAQVVDLNRMAQLEAMFEGIKQTLVVNDEYIRNEFREGILDGARMLEERDNEIDRLMIERVENVEKLKKIEAQNVLNVKLENASPKLKRFMHDLFEGSDKDTIEDTFSEALDAYNKNEKAFRTIIAEEATKKAVKPKQIVLDESATNKPNDLMSQYVSAIKKTQPITKN